MKCLRWIGALLLLGSVAASATTLGSPGRGTAAKKPKPETAADDSARMTAKTFEGLKLRGIGPALMSGRIADIAIHPSDQSVWYVAVGSGGVWRTKNAGSSWESIFDEQPSYSIGCVTVDPNRPDVIWVGTGENVSGRHVGFGDGVYKSLDGGDSWSRMGLEQSEHIGNIVVDPRDSNVVYVAAQGPLWSPGGDRGLFKTTDGGKTWQRILAGGDYTGVNEVHLDPRNPDVLYAATHQRFRNVAALMDGGPESGIHKSTDGGKTWTELTRGLPETDMGKIGLAISPQNPDVIYATIELGDRKGGFWRSENGGGSWEKRNKYLSSATGPHYYQEIFASPHHFDRVYQMDVRMQITEDGGKTFKRVGEDDKHGDNHALAFDPRDPNYLLAGSDGGLYESWDLGKHWKFVTNLSVTQFYKVAVDYDEPFYNIYGGTQDNSTQGGPSRTDNVNGIRSSDWFLTLGGDGHQPAVDPTNPDIVYSQSQQGRPVRYDRKTGEIVFIQPQPARGEPRERFNWDAPILISPHDPTRIYFASQRVWRSDDRGDSWKPISGDLSRGLDRLKLPMMGRVFSIDAPWDVYAMSMYGTITSLAESPVVDGLFYAATDDGLIQVTEDGGGNWRRIDRLPGVADFFFVNDIKADLHDADTVYVAVDQHKTGDFAPYLFKSTDRGRNWTSIAGDLPDRHLVWRVVQDHVNPALLFAGTEFGVFFSVNGGEKWIELSGGAPNISFRDLAIQRRENDLVAASFGRGFWILDDYTPLRQVSEAVLERQVELFPVRDADWYVEKRPLGRSKRATQGADFFIAPNPPFGAVFTYYLRDSLETRENKRRKDEKKIAEEGGDTPHPGWEALREEELEDPPEIVLTVRDAAGNTVRRLNGPVKAGVHRVAWDLRYPSPLPWKERDEDDEPESGYLAAPGTYKVTLARRVDGVLTELEPTQSFRVVPLYTGTLPAAPPAQVADFLKGLAGLRRSVLGTEKVIDETGKRLGGLREALRDSTAVDGRLDDTARALIRRLAELEERLSGNDRRGRFKDRGPVSIKRRLEVAHMGNRLSTYGPTPTHLESLEIARENFEDLRAALERLLAEVDRLERGLESAGVPWSPGRREPG